MVNLEIKDLTKVYNKKTVLDNISFEVKDGEFLSILGPSGCGKTTLLKILIGIENPTSGRILKKEKDITKLDSSKRGMGIVFQNYALFPNMTVLDNVMYALNIKLKNKEEAKKEKSSRFTCTIRSSITRRLHEKLKCKGNSTSQLLNPRNRQSKIPHKKRHHSNSSKSRGIALFRTAIFLQVMPQLFPMMQQPERGESDTPSASPAVHRTPDY